MGSQRVRHNWATNTFIFFTQSSADGHLDSFYFLDIVNNAAMNSYGQVYLWHMFSFHLGIYLRVELLSHMIILCLTLWGTSRLFSRMTEPFYTPTSNIWELLFSAHPPQHLLFLLFYGIFLCVYRPFIHLLWRTVCLELGHLFSTLVSKVIKYKIPWYWLPFHSIFPLFLAS